MLGIGLIVVALILAAVGVMSSRGDTGVDSKGVRVGPVVPGNKAAGVPFFILAAITAAAAAYLLLGGRWS